MKVLKFGGTSLGSAERMRKVADIVANEPDCVVVCSAMAGMTDTLEAISNAWSLNDRLGLHQLMGEMHVKCEKVCRELFSSQQAQMLMLERIDRQFAGMLDKISEGFSLKGKNWMLARGEYLTSDLLCHYLNFEHTDAEWLDALRLIQLVDRGEASIDVIRSNWHSLYSSPRHARVITQGFICLDQSGCIGNLGRGGSDYTATLLGAALGVPVIEIWTDIDGVRNNDPRYVEATSPIRELSFSEAAELAFYGAKILHPSCVWPAAAAGIPIHLRSTLDPQAPGTMIREVPCSKGIRAVAAKDQISIIRIRSARMLNAYGFLHRVFDVFNHWETPIDVITTSEVAVSLTIDDTRNLEPICRDLAALGEITIEHQQSIVCVVGDVLAMHQAYAVRILEALKNIEVNMISFGGSRNNLTVVIPQTHKTQALQLLHDNLFCLSPQNISSCMILET
jgi:aspartate kinase